MKLFKDKYFLLLFSTTIFLLIFNVVYISWDYIMAYPEPSVCSRKIFVEVDRENIEYADSSFKLIDGIELYSYVPSVNTITIDKIGKVSLHESLKVHYDLINGRFIDYNHNEIVLPQYINNENGLFDTTKYLNKNVYIRYVDELGSKKKMKFQVVGIYVNKAEETDNKIYIYSNEFWKMEPLDTFNFVVMVNKDVDTKEMAKILELNDFSTKLCSLQDK